MKNFFRKTKFLIAVFVAVCPLSSIGSDLSDKINYDAGYILFENKIKSCEIILKGGVTSDLSLKFDALSRRISDVECKSVWVNLNSGGGSVSAALTIGDIIRKKKYNTQVGSSPGVECASACGLIFAAGLERVIQSGFFVSGRLGFHQISVLDGGRRICVPELNSQGSESTLKYLRKMLGRRAAYMFHDFMMTTSCEDITNLNARWLITYEIATSDQRSN